MAYNNPQYSGYVSTSANTQAAQQGLAASTARQAQLMQARQQQELKERKAANAKIEKQKEIKTAAFNNKFPPITKTVKPKINKEIVLKSIYLFFVKITYELYF